MNTSQTTKYYSLQFSQTSCPGKEKCFIKPNLAIVLQNASLYSECSSVASNSAANLLSSCSRFCLSGPLNVSARVLPPLRSVRILVPRKMTHCLPKYPAPGNICLCCSNSLDLLRSTTLVVSFQLSSACASTCSASKVASFEKLLQVSQNSLHTRTQIF